MRKSMFSNVKPKAIPACRELKVKTMPVLSGTGNVPPTLCAMSRSGIFLVLIVTMGLLVLPVTAFQTPESIIAAGNVYVSNVTFDPGSFFTDDSGTVTVYVTNGNADQSVVVNHVTFGDKDLRLTSSTYDSTTNIGPLQNLPFVFSVSADAPEGTYYPTFSLSFRDADSLHFRAVIRVDNTPLELTIVDKPDAFTREKKKTIFVQVANPRKNDVRNVILEVSGTGITASPDKIFIGNLATGAKIPVNFTISPEQETDLILALTYNNGNNPHKVTTSLPIAFGIDKMQADPVISNIMVTSSGGIYHITGDVNNAGLETANTVTVTSLSPAVPQDPYKTYVVGALKPDDFGSFEVTFTADGVKSVPLRMSYKDADGNIIDSRQDVTLTVTGPEQQQDQSILLPVFAIVVVIALAGGYLYYRRKKNQ